MTDQENVCVDERSVAKKERNSSIELLRIILMFFIVLSHCYRYRPYANESGILKYFIQFTSASNVMVDVFVLISGYYLCKKDFSLKKLVLLLLEVSFYSIVCYFVAIVCKVEKFSLKNFVISIFPTTFRLYWFVWAYCALYLLSPFINKLLEVLTRRRFLLLMGVVFLVWCFLPLISTVNADGMDIFILIFFYLVGAYLRIYPDNFFFKGKNGLWAFLIGYGLFMLSIIVLNFVGSKIVFLNHPMYFTTKHSVISILFAIGLFSLFVNMDFTNKFVNTVASATFGVYIIHNNGYMRGIIYEQIFTVSSVPSSLKLILYFIGISTIIFVVCVCVDLARKYLLEKPISKLYDKITKKIIIKTLP